MDFFPCHMLIGSQVIPRFGQTSMIASPHKFITIIIIKDQGGDHPTERVCVAVYLHVGTLRCQLFRKCPLEVCSAWGKPSAAAC